MFCACLSNGVPGEGVVDCLEPTTPVSQAAGSQPGSDSWATVAHVLQSAGGSATKLWEECWGAVTHMSREFCRRFLRAAAACEQLLPVGVLLDHRQTRHPSPKRAIWDESCITSRPGSSRYYSTPSGLMHPRARRSYRHPSAGGRTAHEPKPPRTRCGSLQQGYRQA